MHSKPSWGKTSVHQKNPSHPRKKNPLALLMISAGRWPSHINTKSAHLHDHTSNTHTHTHTVIHSLHTCACNKWNNAEIHGSLQFHNETEILDRQTDKLTWKLVTVARRKSCVSTTVRCHNVWITYKHTYRQKKHQLGGIKITLNPSTLVIQERVIRHVWMRLCI